jgi:peptidyl-tRNA hydrolase, PTH1 family
MAKFLIVGLGNIGAEYAGTRHNIGFDIADSFVKKYEFQFKTGRLADIAEVKFTYMNLSGRAVKYWLDTEKVDLDSTLVLVDEVALPLNKIRLRPSGSDGGHNGLKSIQEVLGSDKYPRLRFGIGNDYPKGRQVEYVLGKWSADQLPIVTVKIQKSVEVIEKFITMGIERTMNEVNKSEFML